MHRNSRNLIVTTLAVAALTAAAASAQQIYQGVDGQIGLMVYHTQDPVTTNWVCTAASTALDVDGSGTVETDECWASLPPNFPSFNGFCNVGAVNSSLELHSLTGDKPGRMNGSIYHLVQSGNATQCFGGVPDNGPGLITGDNFYLFECPLSDPNCKTTPPVLINATLRPDNPACSSAPCEGELSDPTCDRYNWQVKSTNEFAPSYNQLEVWAKLQNSGVKFVHQDVNASGQTAGTEELFFKDAVVVMNRTNTAVPFSSANQRAWDGPFVPRPPAQGWENAVVWYMDNRWCDGSFGFTVPGGCPANAPLEARLIDINVERRVFQATLPDLSSAPDSGSCSFSAGDCPALVQTTADAVGFLNFTLDTDREFLAQQGGLCVDPVNGGVTTCASPTIPASCAERTNTSPECLPVTGCNCCEPTNVNQCVNPHLENRSAYVIVDARQALFFPEYNAAGTSIVGWAWVKWGKVLDEIPPLHPGIGTRIIEVNRATTPASGNEWQFWQNRGPGPAPNPIPVATCDQSTTSTALPAAPFTTHDQIPLLSAQQQDAWDCNVGSTDYATLSGHGRVLKYGTFDPDTGVITTTAQPNDDEMRLPAYTHPHMPTWYPAGNRWLAGFLEVVDAGVVSYRSIAWGGTPQMACNVANTSNFKIPGRAIMYEEIEFAAPPECGVDADCDDGLFCNGAETCNAVLGCQAGADPCAPLTCDEVTNSCFTPGSAQLEAGRLTVGAMPVTVNLENSYTSPVVVTTLQYSANTTPTVTRVSSVTPTSFRVRLQSPSGGPVAAENVSYLVVEEGSWTIDGVKVEAQKYTSTVTDHAASWVGQPRSYSTSFVNPVVLGQVMSENDPGFSVFWDRGSVINDPPSASVLRTGKTVCEDTDTTRADETIGFVVFEAGHGSIAGVEFEAGLGSDIVQGAVNAPPYVYPFNAAFASPPSIALATMAGLDGGNGGWAQVHGPTGATATSLFLSIDEDTITDTERSHTTEQVGYVAFTGPVIYPSPGLPVAEWGTVSAGGSPVRVDLTRTYSDPVVVTTIRYSNNTVPVVTRVSGVTAASFDVRLQNPAGAPVLTDSVSYLVVEAGDWTIGGVKLSASKYTSTVTDQDTSWVGQVGTYGQSFVNPVVLGQVMSENDPGFSVFWCQGTTRPSAPSATALTTGKTVCEDVDVTRVDETVGIVVIETVHSTLGGVELEAALGPDTVRGIDDGPPFTYTFNSPFGTAPGVSLATMGGVDGSNGGWAYVYAATASTLSLAIDEDQILDAERNHTTEDVGYVVFAAPGAVSQ